MTKYIVTSPLGAQKEVDATGWFIRDGFIQFYLGNVNGDQVYAIREGSVQSIALQD